MTKRVTELLALLKDKEIDAMIIFGAYNRRYISGFKGSSGYLFISPKKQVFLTDFRYMEQGAAQCPGFEVMDHTKDGLMTCFKQLVVDTGAKSLGFEEDVLTYQQFNQLKNEFDRLDLVGTTGIIETIRAIKDEEELSFMREAAAIADRAFAHILDFIKPGVTELEIAMELEFAMRRGGAKKLSFDTIVASGKNASLPHAEPSDKKVENGDFLTMDFGCLYKGYCSDMTRTVFVGKANEKQKHVYNTVLKAQLAALDAIKAGPLGHEIDKIARDIIYGAGYEGCFGHGLGHSVGLEVHEEPRLSVKGFTKLKENMMITVEPGIYIPDFGGVRIEDLVCIKENGYENLTKSDKTLIEL